MFITPSVYNSDLDYNESFTIENNTIIPFVQIEDNLMKLSSSKIQEELILSENGFISYNEATILFNSFQSNYILPTKKVLKKENYSKIYYAKCMWYSLNDLKKYIVYIEHMSIKNKGQLNGINLFYGVYKNDENLKYPNSQTLFLMPSISKKGSTEINNFDDFKLVIDNISTSKSEAKSMGFANEGEMSPPPPPNN